MVRSPEWLQRGLDALRATLDVGPELKQQMIQFLLDEGFWDARTLTPAAAVARFNGCLNPGKPEFFKITEVWALMLRFERHQLWLAIGADLGYEPPRLLSTEDRRQQLLARLADAQERLAIETSLVRQELARLEGATFDEPHQVNGSGLRIHPANREPGPRFSLDEQPNGGF